ncbi:SulP family inorganic anion transporter [Elizabethkingia meningoseptica]|uniref:SulP family inorganic anion transporter n=1 Tax=Elizabethkingia meningoseptica TaxID=238 RepID=UPI0022F19E24|nr:SulP family inorganic anion transporter [Elizabethkingia meningoseptica]EJK5329994.1 SulP family inorganic anion transporter [Elizabethkingia meningoseptica]MDE5430418.1 SulP family inorganic anion transporter [Elizabethkingia meningoseptica]MDE5437364.1 SulP family inorganic anion transporter [Elizabethkingia meningoseptica]MDE5466415.1 SulP family inorganic anion transporter [Elizabethkingia meningoseptica]MDE5474355.1 SulP family inorganic anion transporter [Elizabethkingia meningoseptic
MKTNSLNFQSFRNINYKNEILAGLTVSMTMIPESLSFAILAGLPPLMGLYAAFLMGIVTAVLGGRPGMVSGGAGATVVVLMALIVSHGTQYLLAAVVLAGVLQLLVGVFRLGKFVRLIPQPVMYGFLNGLAIIIFMAQVEQFKITEHGISTWMSGTMLYIMGGLTLLTVAVVIAFPKISKAIPSSLVAIIIVSALVYFLKIDTKTVSDIASVKGSLPAFHIPDIPITMETLKIIFPYSMIMAGVGLIESLLTLNMVDEITRTKGNSNREAMAQGAANMVNGFFGGMGGCAMVAQTLVNIGAGARTRISAIIGALAILLIIIVGSPVIDQIPMAALVGVMMMVAIGTFQWVSLRIVNKMPKSDIFVGILVAAITVILHNLALAVLVGVIISALVFAWDNAKRIRARKSVDEEGNKVYEIYGPLFFGSTTAFADKFDVLHDTDKVIVDFKESRVADMSAIEALKKLTEQYKNHNKQLVLRHLSADCIRLLENAGGFIEINIEEDPTYNVMRE